MGQYWIPVNLDKHEYIIPHSLGCGLKLREQIRCQYVGAALILLLAAHKEQRGGGDPDVDYPAARQVIGRWVGDRVILVGDYAEDDDFDIPDLPVSLGKLYSTAQTSFTDISEPVAEVLEHELRIRFVGEGWKDVVILDS